MLSYTNPLQENPAVEFAVREAKIFMAYSGALPPDKNSEMHGIAPGEYPPAPKVKQIP
jgi:hypothetical protein